MRIRKTRLQDFNSCEYHQNWISKNASITLVRTKRYIWGDMHIVEASLLEQEPVMRFYWYNLDIAPLLIFSPVKFSFETTKFNINLNNVDNITTDGITNNFFPT